MSLFDVFLLTSSYDHDEQKINKLKHLEGGRGIASELQFNLCGFQQVCVCVCVIVPNHDRMVPTDRVDLINCKKE